MLSTGFNKSSYNTYTINATTTRSKLTATGIKIKYERERPKFSIKNAFPSCKSWYFKRSKKEWSRERICIEPKVLPPSHVFPSSMMTSRVAALYNCLKLKLSSQPIMFVSQAFLSLFSLYVRYISILPRLQGCFISSSISMAIAFLLLHLSFW